MSKQKLVEKGNTNKEIEAIKHKVVDIYHNANGFLCEKYHNTKSATAYTSIPFCKSLQ